MTEKNGNPNAVESLAASKISLCEQHANNNIVKNNQTHRGGEYPGAVYRFKYAVCTNIIGSTVDQIVFSENQI